MILLLCLELIFWETSQSLQPYQNGERGDRRSIKGKFGSEWKVASAENEVTVRKPKLFEYEFILVKLLKYQSEFWFWKTNKKPSGSPSTWINFNAHEKKILVLTLPAA